jgi:hypothetical protein
MPFYVPTADETAPTRATHAVSSGLLASLTRYSTPPPLYLGSTGWALTGTGPTYTLGAAALARLQAGGTVSPQGEGWVDASGAGWRLVAVTDASGDRHGITVMAGPSDPPQLL